jgi:replicative DNA helicase
VAINEELRLVTKIVDTGDFMPVYKANVTPDHFQDAHARAIFKRILSDWRKYNGDEPSVPTREVIEQDFPTVILPKEDRQSLKAILDSFLNRHLVAELSKLADDIISWSDTPEEMLIDIAHRTRELTRIKRVGQDVVLSSALQEVRDRYESNRDQDGIKGIPYPWEILNHATQGMLPGEFILFYGRPKSLKTWVLLSLATFAYEAANRRVMVYTREMTPQQMMDRCVCLLIEAPYTAYKEGTLAEIPVPEGGTMEDRFYNLTESMRVDEETCALETGYNKSLIITSDREDPKGGGVVGLKQKVKDHKPDLICADALYLMRNDRVGGRRSVKWDDQAALTQDLKDLALDSNLPLIGTTQAKRASEDTKGKSVSNISFSDSYGMDCDLAVEIIKKKITDETNELALAITGAREINISGFAVHGNPASSFDQLYEKYRDETGTVRCHDNGDPIMIPVVFSDYKDIKNFLKVGEEDDKPANKKTKAQYAALAKLAFKSAKRIV